MPFPDAGNGPYRVLRAFSAGAVRRFDEARAAPRVATETRLALVAGEAVGTAFGREHGLTGREDLRTWRQLPIRDGEAYRPWLDRIADGEPSVLTRAPVRMLVETSGTTGRSKWLPVTDAWAASVAEAQRLWVLGLLRDDEGLASGAALSVVSAAEHARSPGGLPIGSNTGRMFRAQPWWVRWRAPVPYLVYTLPDPELRAYVVLRHALAHDVRSWTTANPSTLLAYLRRFQAWEADLAADLADGTLCHGPAASMSPADRKRYGAGMKRARLAGDGSLPWALRRLNCWTGGPAPFFVRRLPEAFGREIPVREVGISASEGFFAVPVDDGDPVAWLGGHVLELLDGDTPLWPWEAEVGREYRLLLSTEAGLYRYDIGDVVEVTGWLDGLPRLRFVRKVGNLLNSVGERVTEAQIAAAAASAFPRARHVSATLRWAEVPQLRVAVCEDVEGGGGAGADPDEADPGLAFDRALSHLNVEYESKRSSGRLGPPLVRRVPEARFVAWRAARVAAGASDAQVKDPIVLPPERWEELVG